MKIQTIVKVNLLLASVCALALLSSASTANGRRHRAGRHDMQVVPGQTSTLLPNGNLLLLGGEGPNGPLSSAQILDPQTQQVSNLPSRLQYPRAWHSATLLPNGTVLVFGGVDAKGHAEGIAEIFDLSSESFASLTSTGLTPRSHHTATLLTDGRVVIAGGLSDSGETLGSIELWAFQTDVGTNSSAGLLVPRSRQTATLLADGAVLLWGGIDRNGSPLSYGEVFDPATQRTTIETVEINSSANEVPQLAASLPPDGTQGLPVDSLIALRFSKPLSVVTVNAETVTLSSSGGVVTANVIPAEGGRLAFVTPVSSLEPGTAYTLSGSGLSDGTNTLDDLSISFTTAGTPPSSEAGLLGSGDPDDTGSQAFNSPSAKLPPLEAPPGATAISGQALRLDGSPLENVTLSIGNLSAKTDSTGRFLLSGISAGHQVMLIDGSTANKGDRTYGLYEDGVNITVGQTNVLSYKIWMTRIDTAHEVTIPSPTVASDTVITTPRLPGLELHLAVNTVIYDRKWNVVTTISITPIPVDKPPFPLPQVQVPIYFTIQPGGAYIQVQGTGGDYKGARLIYPNTYHAKPGTQFDFWNYDPSQKGWYIYGEGKVSQDGRSVIPNPGVEIYGFTGAMVGTPGGEKNPAGQCYSPKCKAAEPVDLSSGLFIYHKTDLALPDVIPLNLTRTYTSDDGVSRSFGIGAMQDYDIFISGDTNPYTYMELMLPDGTRIYFYRTSSGTSFGNAVYAHTASQTAWYGATITYNTYAYPGAAWVLRTRDGTNYYFPDSNGLTNPARQALIGVQGRYGDLLSITRDVNLGFVTKIVSPNGRYITFQNDSSNRITQAQDNIGRTVSYAYDSSGRLSTVTDANGGVTTYTYDSNNNMLTIEDARGIVYLTNQYDSNQRISKQTLADGSTYQFAWVGSASSEQYVAVVGGGGSGPFPSQVGQFRTCTTCSEGYLPLVSQADVTDPRGIVREVKFNSTGQISTDTYALGKSEQQIFTYVYYADNLIQSVTDQLGRTTGFSYDYNGNPTSITQLAGTSNAVTTSLAFDPTFSQITSWSDPLNHTASFAYDIAGRLTSITDPLNNQTTIAPDSEGRPLSITDPLSHTTQFQYYFGDIASITDPLGRNTNQFHDGGGRLLSVTNPLGQVTKYSYDNLNEVMAITDPLSGRTSFTYDADGDLLTVVDAQSHTTTYTYNNVDRLSTRKDPLGNSESYQFDSNGNLTEFTDRRGEVTMYAYDNLNRRTFAGFNTQSGPTYESTITNTFDAGNRLTQAVDSVTGTITRTFDGLDRMTQETTPQGSVSYSYDAVGRRTSLTVAGQTPINYSYDNSNRLTQVTQGTNTTASFAYDAANRRTSLVLPNGVTMSYTYDSASQLTGINYALGQSALGNLTYSYDLTGRRTNMGGSYAAVNLPSPIATTAYNANNQLTQWGAATPTYDANGNTLSDGTNAYVWNGRNQLASMNSGADSFQYDPFGRRVSKTILLTTTNYLYDHGNVAQEISGTTPTANLLTGDSDEYFQRTDSNGAASFLTDALGSALAVTNSSGSTLAQYTYEPFGNTTITGGSANPYQYTGRENDGTGLYFYRARFYSPILQRFVSEDPIGLAGGINKYSYVLNAPATFRDPSGLICTCLQVFVNTALHPEEGGPLGPNVEDVTEEIQGGLQTAGAGITYAAGVIYNQALQYGGGLASAASAAGTISYGFRSTILNGLFNASEELSSIAEGLTSEAVVGETGLVGADVLLANALGAEIEAVRNGTCIPEGEALRIILFGQ
jgi:RHS repeat-associated protein